MTILFVQTLNCKVLTWGLKEKKQILISLETINQYCLNIDSDVWFQTMENKFV